jgi:hypothetical protein
MMPEPFEILSLAKDASKSQIKKRHRPNDTPTRKELNYD